MSASEKTERLLRLSLPVTALVKNEANPNKMAAREFDLLIDNIERTGLTDPILVRPLDYEKVFEIATKFDMPDLGLVLTKEELKYRIVGGHHRLPQPGVQGVALTHHARRFGVRQQRSVVELDRLPDRAAVEQALHARDVGLDVPRQPVRIGIQPPAEKLAQAMNLDTGGA